VGADEAKQTSEEDYADFVLWEETMVGSLEKTMIGWDELGVLPIQAPTIAQYWYDEARALAAVTSGAQLIASPAEHAYLDMVYDQYSTFGQIWVGPVNIERSYRWDPVLEGMDESMVLGVEAALWTEYIDTEEKVDFMVWPRLSAIAEVAWSDHSDWTDFRERLAGHGQRLQSLEVGFYASPEIDWE
jgi:hexosaminidase